jgi:replicative superfamily II helicase
LIGDWPDRPPTINLGEYRRRTANERVVYVCATRQLARQIYERLSTYGVPAVLLIGKTTEFNRSSYSALNT